MSRASALPRKLRRTLQVSVVRGWQAIPRRNDGALGRSRQSTLPSGQRGIVCIAMRAPAISVAPVERSERGAGANPLRQIRIGDEGAAKRAGVGVTQTDRLGCSLRRIGSRRYERARESGAEQGGVVQRAVVELVRQSDLGASRLDQMKVREAARAKLAHRVGEE